MNISGPLSASGYYPIPAATGSTRSASDEAAATEAPRPRQAPAAHERVMQGELLHGGRGRRGAAIFERARGLDGYSQPGSSQNFARHALDQYLENSQTAPSGAGPTIDYYA